MVKVLFVCLGNICRSPMAEAIMRKLADEAGLGSAIEVDSAGTGDWHVGKPPHAGTRSKLDENGIGYEGMAARQVKAEDAQQYDYIIAMDEDNVLQLRRIFRGSGPEPSTSGNVIKMLAFHPDSPLDDVPDPYYTGNFQQTYELLQESCRRLLQHLRDEHGLA